MPSLLVVDDDRSVVQIFRRGFQGTEVEVLAAGTAAEGQDVLAQSRPDVVVLDVFLPDQSGLQTFQQIHAYDPTVPIIFITAGGTSNTAIEAMKLGAFDYLLKPLDLAKVRELVAQALRIKHFMDFPVKVSELPGGDDASDTMVGRCPAMQEVY